MTIPRIGRLASLDGVRGVAAAVVAVHHALLLIPSLAAPYLVSATVGGLAGILTYSPAHLVWAGTEAVYLFFVLSGIVLALGAQRAGFTWERYFPSRLVRLYLPVIAAVLFAAITIQLVPRTDTTLNAWLVGRPSNYDLSSLLTDMMLVGGVSNVVTPLWSLQWEVIFSLAIPAYLAVSRVMPMWAQLVIAFGLSQLGSIAHVSSLTYLPMFGVGVALASGWASIEKAAGRLNNWAWAGVLTVSLLATLAYWMLWPAFQLPREYTHTVVLAGVTGVVLAAAFSPWARAVLTIRLVQWLGRISFSLYLVHEPIVVAVGFALPGRWWASLIALAIAFPLAWLFYLVVERPSHKLAQRIARGPALTAVADAPLK